MVKKEVLGAATLSILVNNYLPSVANILNFVVFWLCMLVLLYSIVFLIRATLKSRRKNEQGNLPAHLFSPARFVSKCYGGNGNTPYPVIMLYACLILFIILMGIDIFLGKSLSNGVSKLLLCTSCLAILGMIITR